MPKFQFAAVIQDHEEIPRFARGLPLHEVWLRGTLLNMPRGQGATRLAAQLKRRLPSQARLGLYAWHYLTHRQEDALPGRGTRTLQVDTDSGPCGHLQDTSTCEAALDASVRALGELGGNSLILATPASMTPGAVGRRRLRGFFERCAGRQLDLVWEPTGLWTPQDIMSVVGGTAARGVLSDTEVSAAGGEAADCAWVRVGGAGQAVHLGDAQAESLAFLLEDCFGDRSARVVFSGPRAFSNLRNFHKATSQLG